MKKIIILAMSVLISTASFAAGRNAMLLGIGSALTCGGYVTMDAGDKELRTSWALGYMSALNVWFLSGADIFSGMDIGAVRISLDNYCQKNPLEQYAKAVIAVADQLVARANKK